MSQAHTVQVQNTTEDLHRSTSNFFPSHLAGHDSRKQVACLSRNCFTAKTVPSPVRFIRRTEPPAPEPSTLPNFPYFDANPSLCAIFGTVAVLIFLVFSNLEEALQSCCHCRVCCRRRNCSVLACRKPADLDHFRSIELQDFGLRICICDRPNQGRVTGACLLKMGH
ncbi:hypothetical protein KC327_g83 [Hortaea werneckii]|nr:hypothetical protein KC327_g83 [Hortaea werneckii]